MSSVIFIITTIALLLSTIVVVYHCELSFFEVFPVNVGILILALYVLAFFRGMNLITIISGIIAVLSLLYLGKNPKAFHQLKALDIFALLILSIVAILTSRHVFTWWDDVNFWATDVKSLYFLNGFPGKYGNVAPEFGDYPPGTQMLKWLFLKLSNTYREGLAFSGYYVMVLVFLFPVMGAVRKKNIITRSISLVILFFVPGICNIIWSQGTAADTVMAVVYGSLLISIIDYKGKNRMFYYIRIGVFSAVLCLCKSNGFEWAIFALIFYLIFIRHLKKNEGWEYYSSSYILLSIGIPIVTLSSWLLFCLRNRRIANLTSSGINILTGGHFVFPDYIRERIRLYLKGFAFCPMHTDKTNLLNLSSLSLVVLLILLVIFLGRKKVLDVFEKRLILVYLSVTCLISYGVVLIGHATLFSMETQYDTAEVITISFSRYCSPFTIGMIMLILYIILERVNDHRALIICGIFILCSTEMVAYHNALFGYRVEVDNDIAYRDAVLNSFSKDYVDRVSNDRRLWGHRVLLLRNGTYEHRVEDTYTNYYASPVPTVYADFNIAQTDGNDLLQLVNTKHAEYIYAEPSDAEYIEELSYLMMDCEFRYATIYEIVYDGTDVKLKEVLN